MVGRENQSLACHVDSGVRPQQDARIFECVNRVVPVIVSRGAWKTRGFEFSSPRVQGASTYETLESGHGRRHHRIIHDVRIPRDYAQRENWRDLNTLAAVTTCRTVEGNEHWQTRFYISSHESGARRLGASVRQHWSTKNSQYHVLDVTFAEDNRRQSHRHGAANLTAVRRPVLSVLRQEKSYQRGAKCKRFTCVMDSDYLNKVLSSLKTSQV